MISVENYGQEVATTGLGSVIVTPANIIPQRLIYVFHKGSLLTP
jgi:hypothetical protein